MFPLPDGLSDAEGAALPVNYLTAFIALYRLANVTPGETVLIHGAGGGVGIAATQLANLRRATVIGTASAVKHDALRSFGDLDLLLHTEDVWRARDLLFREGYASKLRLKPGETFTAVAKRPHLVTNVGKGSLTFLVLQGMGEYDYVPMV